MVFFKTLKLAYGVRHLVILNDEHQPMNEGTYLRVDKPTFGKYADPVTLPSNEFRLKEWSHKASISKSVKALTLGAVNHEHPDPNDVEPLPTLGRRIVMGKAGWGGSMSFAGEFHFTEGYWEWTEDILSRCKKILRDARIYDSVFASLFTYDCNSELIKAFCEAWYPAINTVLTSIGEMSLSLWDVHDWMGLPLTGHLFDEVVPDEKKFLDKTSDIPYVPQSC